MTIAIDLSAARDARGRFQPGMSGNPAGKLPGTLNRATKLKRLMDDSEDDKVTRSIIDRALSGKDRMAERFVFDSLAPKERARPAVIPIALPIDASRVEKYEIVLHAIADGEIAPDEALKLATVIDRFHKAQDDAARAAAAEAEAARLRAGLAAALGELEALRADFALHSACISGDGAARRTSPPPPSRRRWGGGGEGARPAPQTPASDPDLLHSACISTSPSAAAAPTVAPALAAPIAAATGAGPKRKADDSGLHSPCMSRHPRRRAAALARRGIDAAAPLPRAAMAG